MRTFIQFIVEKVINWEIKASKKEEIKKIITFLNTENILKWQVKENAYAGIAIQSIKD